jgi:hypothetical protein
VLGVGLATVWYVWSGLELWRAGRQGARA